MLFNEILERLLLLDEEAELVFPEDISFSCYIVGGGALLLMGYISRSTHDIDILETVPNQLNKLFCKYDINSNVSAYYMNFPVDFEIRAQKININTNKVTFYTLSLEDLVISKLCTTRYSQDIDDIENEKVINSINWETLDKLAHQMEYTILSTLDYENFICNYKSYVGRFRNEENYTERLYDDLY